MQAVATLQNTGTRCHIILRSTADCCRCRRLAVSSSRWRRSPSPAGAPPTASVARGPPPVVRRPAALPAAHTSASVSATTRPISRPPSTATSTWRVRSATWRRPSSTPASSPRHCTRHPWRHRSSLSTLPLNCSSTSRGR